MSPDDLARALVQPGRASIPYLDRYNPERPLVLECFRPQGHNPDKPVVIVQHGASRNGAEYCEAWVPAAERHGLLINRGDVLHRWTNERFLSTPHRVRNVSGRCVTRSRSSAPPITARSSNGCQAAGRPI